MKILGIDPGSRKAGFALVNVQGRKLELITSGILRYERVPEFLERLSLIYETCLSLTTKLQPDEIAIESLIYVKNVSSLAKLAQARGAMIAGLNAKIAYKINEYSPNLIKSIVTGYGHADKASVDKTLALILGRKINFQSHDESDAVAIAICHAFSRGSSLPAARSGGSSLKNAFKHLDTN